MNDMTASPAFNPAVKQLAPPPIPAVQAALKSYDGGAGPVIDLSQAVPGYAPHADLVRWLGETAGRADLYGYGPIEGEDVLRTALASDLQAAYGAELRAAEVQITAGANQAFFAVALALLRPGDEVILIRPYYFNHEMTLRMLGVDVKIVDADPQAGFVPSLATVEASISARTRAVFVVTPNNPTGAVYPTAFLDALYDCCHSRGVFVIADETYRDFLPAGFGAPHALFSKPNWHDSFIHLYSFSKVFCIPGHRLGAIVCGPKVMEQLQKVMDNLQICAPRPAQYAVAKALETLSAWRRANTSIIDERRQAFHQAIDRRAGWSIVSIGAYFAYLRHPFPGREATGVTQWMAAEFGILMLPGTCFGDNQQDFVRAAFANVGVDAIRALETRLPLARG
ncbi:aminotransferase [Neorhizobium sp. NPDC001467]|uniref:aminotransferase n=1 Tax=Neorhizobium sp. NPDC001467 TaxID=3390595 RepID=UPI003D05FB71